MTTKTKKKSSKKKLARETSVIDAKPSTNGTGHNGVTIQGVAVLVPGGKKKPGRRGTLAYLSAKQIKIVEGFNPRQTIGDLTDLEKMIRHQGLLENLIVRPSGDGKTFLLVDGERRLRALRNLGAPFTDDIGVNIRTDLEGKDKDLDAKAIAIAASAEEGRSNLDLVDIGTACAEMKKKGWSIEAIASATGLHAKKVRRCLEIMKADADIVKKVKDGELGMMAAIEMTRLPKDMRAKILADGASHTTIESVRRARKTIERSDRAEAIAKSEDRSKTKAGKARDRKLVVRRSSRELTDLLRRMCHTLQNLPAKERETDTYFELRGGVAALMWVQGEIEDAVLPSTDPSAESDPKAARKVNAAFDILVKNEAAAYKPEDDEEVEAEEEE